MEPVTVADVLLHARDLHPAFNRQATGDAPLLRFLTRYQQEMLARIADIKRDAVQKVYEVSIPTAADWEAGESLPDHILIHKGDVVWEDTDLGKEEFEVVAFSQRQEANRNWGGWIQEGRLRLMHEAADWEGIERIDLFYFPLGEDLTGRTSEFDLPGRPLPLLTAAASYFMALRAPAGAATPIDVGRFGQDKLDAEEKYLDEVTGRRRAVVSRAREVW